MKLNLLISVALSLSFICLQAQESSLSSGGDASGEGGSLSYSIGQVVYSKYSGTTGSMSEGVQQPYEISVIIGIEKTDIKLDISAFPNPTSDYLILKIADDANNKSRSTMALYDINGRLIKEQVLVANETSIDMADLKSATYFLRILISNQEVKTFKIIKN